MAETDWETMLATFEAQSAALAETAGALEGAPQHVKVRAGRHAKDKNLGQFFVWMTDLDSGLLTNAARDGAEAVE